MGNLRIPSTYLPLKLVRHLINCHCGFQLKSTWTHLLNIPIETRTRRVDKWKDFHRYISFQPKDEVLSYREGNQWTVVISRDLKVFIRESEINGKDEEMDVALVKWKYNQWTFLYLITELRRQQLSLAEWTRQTPKKTKKWRSMFVWLFLAQKCNYLHYLQRGY